MSSGSVDVGEEDMTTHADLANKAMDEGIVALAQAGRIANTNFITVTKAQDLSYLEGKDMVSLTEALGAREVAAKTTPGGPSPAS